MKYEEALELLRRPELGDVIDLTGRNVQQLKDRKAKQVLEPILQKALPRRRRGIEYSSYYRALRVALLQYNPYFKKDIADIRKLFHIPKKQITAISIKRFPHRREPWDKVDMLDSAQAASWWLAVHECNAKKVRLVPDIPPLPQWLIDSASTVPEFGENAPLTWLQKKPEVPAFFKRFDWEIPIDHCVARLIERYGLPWQCDHNIRKFTLTLDPKYLESILPFDVIIGLVDTPIGKAYRVTIDWIDEYTTKKQWDEIYEKVIKPNQRWFWEQRGDLPHSRQIDLKHLMEPWLIELYSLMVQKKKAGRKIGIDCALELMSVSEKLPTAFENIDRTTVYRCVKTLDTLCQPQDQL